MPKITEKSPFDVKTVESLAALMTQHDLSEIYLRDGDQQLRLQRGAAPVVTAAAVPFAAAVPAAATPAVPTPPEAPNSAAKKNLIEIKSDTIGVFYAQGKPGDPPYVSVGDRVTPEKPVGMIVVMKTNHEIQAGCTGVIREVVVKNEQSVDFNQVLFRVEPS